MRGAIWWGFAVAAAPAAAAAPVAFQSTDLWPVAKMHQKRIAERGEVDFAVKEYLMLPVLSALIFLCFAVSGPFLNSTYSYQISSIQLNSLVYFAFALL